MAPTTGIGLQRSWCSIYNNILQVKRPSIKIANVPSSLNATYSTIFKYIKALKSSQAAFETLAITAATAFTDRALFVISELATSNPNEGDNATYYPDEDDNTTDNPDEVDANDATGDTVDNGVSDAVELRLRLLSKAKLFSHKEEIYKLLMSGCVNMMSAGQRYEYKHVLSEDHYNSIIHHCSQIQMKHFEPIPIETDVIIDEIFDALLPCRFHRDTNRTIIAIDRMKSSVQGKKSVKYVILSIVWNIISDITCWENESHFNESIFVAKFENILDLLFAASDVLVRDGERTSDTTKRMAIINDYDSTFGRRTDLLVIGNDYELANIELKKAAGTTNISKYQQSKNIRINSCILNQINLMTDSTENTILYDFIGRHGYLAQLFEYQSVYVCQKLHSINISGRMLELESFRGSLKLMFVWKSHMTKLNNSITLAKFE